MGFARTHAAPKSGFRRWLRRIALVLLAVLALPYLLTPLYAGVDPVSTPMLWRWLTGKRVERTVVPLDEMGRALPVTVMAAEDARFCAHRGVDWTEIRAAMENAEDLAEARGGSTITQQVAKNLFLWQGRSFVRKALELPLALWIDLVLPKRRVMEIYLNVAEWGPDGQFGAAAGARHAFGKPVKGLTPQQAALLAAVLPNPHRRSAARPGPGVRRLAGIFAARARSTPAIASCLGLPGRA